MFLRGAVAALMLFHLCHLALPGARPAARAALAMFTMSVLGYLFCQQADVLLALPRPMSLVLMALCVSSTAWMWLAARALFDDHFGCSARAWAAPIALMALGLAANLPLLPEAEGLLPAAAVTWLGRAHAVAMLGFAGAALWEVVRGGADDLVEPRRSARRWVAMGVGVYAAIALIIELTLRGQPIGRLLPALHVAGIGLVTLALAVLVARKSLDAILGTEPVVPGPAPGPPLAPPIAVEPPAAAAGRTPTSAALARLTRAMEDDRLYRREGLTLDALAAALGSSERALRQLINQDLGYRNFNDFLHHYRLKEATHRLAAEDLPILTIALDCGYGSIGPFNRAFRQRHGMTPSEFRGASRLSKGNGKN